jgi:hypothetical protein
MIVYVFLIYFYHAYIYQILYIMGYCIYNKRFLCAKHKPNLLILQYMLTMPSWSDGSVRDQNRQACKTDNNATEIP